MQQFEFLKILNSPFKIPRVKFYIGKVAIGTPYFHPRNWVKPTPKMAMDAAIKELARRKKWHNANPDVQLTQYIKSLDEMYKEKLGYLFPVPKKIGFDFVGLGYKTKWSETDYRHEWNPIWSFVFFKWQIALIFTSPERECVSQYWEAWLYYQYHTKGSKQERIKQCKKDYPQKYTINRVNGDMKKVDYYDIILK
jgi:hypothetical protein